MLRLCLALVLVCPAIGLEVVKKEQEQPAALIEQKETDQKLAKLKTFQFVDYVRQFNRRWEPGTEEWHQREAIFKKNLQSIIDHHSGPAKSWAQGINKFMDYKEDEFKKLLGRKGGRSYMRAGSLLQQEKEHDNTTAIVLPAKHDWRPKLIQAGAFQRDQGACGSCWAFAAVECLESHLEIQHGKSTKLSAQFLVSCMPNEEHCGGKGGCDGATANLAFDYIEKNGIPAEHTWPYTSFAGRDGVCNPALKAQKHVEIERWEHLPVNQDAPLAHALYQHGPVVVSVDGSPWSLYSEGIFSGCDKDAIVNHAVVAEGFGEEVSLVTSKLHKYYLLKNSWGKDWGEKGYIRLERFEDDNAYCGIDTKPEDGNGCDGGPAAIPVCGMCGVTSDSSFPRTPTFSALGPAVKALTPNAIMQKGFKDLIKRR